MSTQVAPDTTPIEELDFTLSCVFWDCNHEADWLVVMTCGHHFTYCDPHWQELIQLSGRSDVEWYCAHPCRTHWTTLGEGVADAHRIR